jgi:hypothetical protein
VRSYEYENWPRGRIVFDRSRDLFIIYADRKVLTPATIARIKTQFHLPAEPTEVKRHCANRSLSTAEPVSAPPKWKLENGEQRPAPETLAQRTEMPEIARQRPAPASLTRGKINDFHRPGKIGQETELRGWGTWIRTKID